MNKNYIQSDKKISYLKKMGNEVCNINQPQKYQFYKQSIKSQEQFSNLQKQQLQSSSTYKRRKNRLSYLKNPTSTIQLKQVSQQQLHMDQNKTQIQYNNFIIRCKKSSISYIKPIPSQSPIPNINGIAQVYKKTRSSSSSLQLQKQSNLLYQGQMRKSKFDGYGKLYKDNKIIYQGEFKNNKYNGWGITINYQGQFRDGKYDGYGIYKEYENDYDKNYVTVYYQGYFQNGLYSGSGVQIKGGKWPIDQIHKIHTNDGIFDFVNLQIQHDLEIITKYGIEEIYIGQFSNGYWHGFGRHITQKQQFNGQFSCNMYHGLGTIFHNTKQGKKVKQAIFKMGQPQK